MGVRRVVFGCFVDESGDDAVLPSATSPIQPLLILLGLAFDLSRLRAFTIDFLDLKARFFPGLFRGRTSLERILYEVKGVDVRKAFRRTAPQAVRHHHIGFLDALLGFVQAYDCRIFGRVWIKTIGNPVGGTAIYTSSMQAICNTFNALISSRGNTGILIPDPRTHALDRRVSFSIFTQKFRAAGDAFPHLHEMPVFGQSANHAGVQVCDLLCSALVFPIAAYAYCTGYINNIHVDPGFQLLKLRYGPRLESLQYRYPGPVAGNWLGGIIVSDPLGKKHSGHLFR